MIDDMDLTDLIQDAEARRCRAMVDVEAPALEQMLDDDLGWIHASGRVDRKATLIASLARDKPYRRLAISNHVVRRVGDACISTGTIEVALAAPSAPPPYLNLFTNIWLLDGTQWMLIHGQSTRCATKTE
jgi:hypothetical protein